MRVADYIIKRLEKEGVKTIFQVTGRGSLFLSDAIARNSEIKSISMHHEQACAFAATAYAEINEKIGVALSSTGCASTNMITGVLNAWQDEIPCLFISGQNQSRETTALNPIDIRTYGQQEANIEQLVKPITKYSKTVGKPREIYKILEEAIKWAYEKQKGPTWIDVPLDIQSAILNDEEAEEKLSVGRSKRKPDNILEEDIEIIMKKLKKAERPVILGGSELRGQKASEFIKKLSEEVNIPFVYTNAIPHTYGSHNENSIGSVGAMACSRAANIAIQNSDYCLVLGSKLCSLVTGEDAYKFARNAWVTGVYNNLNEYRKHEVVDHGIEADAVDILEKLYSSIKKDTEGGYEKKTWLAKCRSWKKLFSIEREGFLQSKMIDIHDIAVEISNNLRENTTIVTDSGLCELILPTNIAFKEKTKCIHPHSQGSMGYALPAAIGAYAGTTTDKIIAIIGDGSIMMNIQELQTIVHNKMNISIIIVNNGAYAVIRRRQKNLFRKRTIGTDVTNGLSCPEYEKVAKAFEIEYIRIEGKEELKTKIGNMYNNRSCIIEIFTRHDQDYIEMGTIKSEIDGKIKKRPLEDQKPFIDRELLKKEMVVELIDQ